MRTDAPHPQGNPSIRSTASSKQSVNFCFGVLTFSKDFQSNVTLDYTGKLSTTTTTKKLRGLSPQENYTDRATAAGRRS
jgi:hypothetical protein